MDNVEENMCESLSKKNKLVKLVQIRNHTAHIRGTKKFQYKLIPVGAWYGYKAFI